MPVITIQFIKDVVATPEQKRELLEKMTETFVSVLGEVVRPYTYCIIQETPVGEWSIAGVPMPNLEFLVGEYYSKIHPRANEIMKQVIAQQKADSGNR
jgi:4-oxalocrotonate tautomerase